MALSIGELLSELRTPARRPKLRTCTCDSAYIVTDAVNEVRLASNSFPGNKSHSPSAFAVLAGLLTLLARATTCRPCEYIMSPGFHGELASSGALLPPVEGAPI